MTIGSEAKGVLQGSVQGEVYPPAAPRPLPDMDARTHALRRFRLYISLLDFARTGAKDTGQVIPFRVPVEDIHVEQPDDPADLRMPGIAFLPAEGTQETYGLGPGKVMEETADAYGVGLVLVATADYVEEFIVEAWGSNRAERRALVAGLTEALTLSAESYSTRLTLPAYYDRIATFELNGTRYIDDPDVIKGRRRAHLRVKLTVPEVRLVPYRELLPYVAVETVDGGYEAAVQWAATVASKRASGS